MTIDVIKARRAHELAHAVQARYRARLLQEIERENEERRARARAVWEGGLIDARGLMLLAR